jgi:hypothetical protein
MPTMRRLTWTVAAVILVLVVVVAIPAINAARIAAIRIQHENNLKAIGLALHNYYDDYLCLPPALVLGPDNQAWHSWRVLLLPYLGDAERELHARYRFDEPWDGPHNRLLLPHVPRAYALQGTKTPYHGVISPQTAWPAQVSTNFAQFIDGTSNRILLLIDADSDIEWMEPRELSYRQAWESNQRLHVKEAYPALKADGSILYVGRMKEEWIFATWLCLQGPDPVTRQPLAGLPPGFLETGDAVSGRRIAATELTSTVVLPSASQAIPADKSALWCATFQLGWDRLRQKFPGVIDAPLDRLELIQLMDAQSFPVKSLAPETYDVTLRVDTQRSVEPEVSIEVDLKKELKFVPEFEEHESGMEFEDAIGTKTKVAAFGISEGFAPGLGTPVWVESVFVRDYISDENFVLELKTKSAHNDRIILARCPLQATLTETLDNVSGRIKSPHKWHDRPSITNTESLEVPVIDLQLEKQFDELLGARIVQNGKLLGEVSTAEQSLKLRLDRRGTKLISKARVGLTIQEDGYDPPPKVPRKFVFDRPFFLALLERDAEEPYFLAWIAHAELMIPHEEQASVP